MRSCAAPTLVNTASYAPAVQQPGRGSKMMKGRFYGRPKAAAAAERMSTDADILAEADRLSSAMSGLTVQQGDDGAALMGGTAGAVPAVRAEAPPSLVSVPLNWRRGQGGHRPNEATRRMLAEAGGQAGLRKFTALFYQKAFADPVLDKFIREHSDPHGHRFGALVFGSNY